MKNRYIKLVAFLSITAIITSCNSIDINATSKDNADELEGIVDLQSATASVNGMYDLLSKTEYYGRNFLVAHEVSSDNAVFNPVNSGRFTAEYQYSKLSTTESVQGLWKEAYRIIGAANLILEFVNKASDATSEQLNEIKGQALVIRALAHFDLVRTYAFPYNTTDASVAQGANGKGGHLGIPIVTTFDRNPNQSRATVANVYKQIIDDLETAELVLPNTTYLNASKFNKFGAKALLARVYLYKVDYENAYKLADDVMKNSPYSLTPNDDVIESWSGNTTSSEMIVQLPASAKNNNGYNSLGAIYLSKGIKNYPGYGDLIPSQDLLDLYTDYDVRKKWYKKEKNNTIYNFKYPLAWFNNVPVIRLSEMYLIKAEATANGAGNIIEGVNALNAIIKRANPNATSVTSSGIDFLNRVLLERRKELAFEGHRQFDIVRTKNSLERKSTSSPSDLKIITYPDTRMVWPISQEEMDANTLMIQNRGY